LFLKGQFGLHIIQVYLHANFANNKIPIQETCQQLATYIEDAQRRGFKLIVMGDFNINPKNYLQAYHTNSIFLWKYDVLHHLVSKNLVDTVNLYQDITTQNSHDTFISKQQSSSPSRVDLI